MRITRLDKRGAIWLWPAAWLVIVAAPLPAQTAPDPPRLAVSASVAFAHPLSSRFRDHFGSAQMPVSVQLECRVFYRIYAFSAFQNLSAEGQTTVEQASFAEEAYSLRFRMSSAKLGGSIREQLGKLALQAGAGVSSNWYREEVEGASLTVSGRSTGFLAQAAVSYPLKPRFSLLGRLEFSSIPSRPDPATGKKIDLGAIEISGGLLIRLF